MAGLVPVRQHLRTKRMPDNKRSSAPVLWLSPSLVATHGCSNGSLTQHVHAVLSDGFAARHTSNGALAAGTAAQPGGRAARAFMATVSLPERTGLP